MVLDMLDLSSYSTNAEVSSAIKERVQSISVSELITELAKEFVQHEEATRHLYAALATNNNCILYGPGGYGKSVLIKAVCKILGVPLIYKVGYENMTPEELLGVPNMKSMLEDSIYETAFENSVFAFRGILCIEEGLDMSNSCAASLKDILTEKGFREGNTKKESLISTVILTGNKDPNVESTSDSIKAMYLERFPYRYKVQWKSYTEVDYMKLFSVLYNNVCYQKDFKKLTLVSRICSSAQEAISPRVAGQAADVVINLGVGFLDTISSLDTSLVKSMKYQINMEALVLSEKETLEKIKTFLDDLILNIENTNVLKDLESKKCSLMALADGLNLKTFSDSSFTYVEEIWSTINKNVEYLEDKIKNQSFSSTVKSEISNLFL